MPVPVATLLFDPTALLCVICCLFFLPFPFHLTLIRSPSLCSVTLPRTKTPFLLLKYLIHFVSLFGVASCNGEQTETLLSFELQR